MTVTLTINGQQYRHWTSVRLTRGLKRCCSDFRLEMPGELVPSIVPMQRCTVSDGAELLLTGYIVAVNPDIGPRETRAEVIGQSKTQDLVDCMPEFDTSQFTRSPLDAIARAIAKPFGIGVVIGPGVVIGDAFPDATLEPAETAFGFLERLARQRGVLLTDDASGNLVLATAGTARAPADLVMGDGGNVTRAKGRLNAKGRFSKYIIRSQAGMVQTGSNVLPNVEAVAYDHGVPADRYRPWAGVAESALMPGDAQIRANWEAAHRSGAAVQAMLTVPEWRARGALWQMNQLARCIVPRLGLDRDLLIGQVEYLYDEKGKRTVCIVAPASAFTPEPETAAAAAGAGAWTGIVKVVP